MKTYDEIHICSELNCNHHSHNRDKNKDLEYKRPFVQIHLHSFMSLVDGANNIDKCIEIAKQNNHPGFAITDHGNPAFLFDFYTKMKNANLKPILGLEFYMAKDLTLKKPNREREWDFKDTHQSIYIKNQTGYKNFNKLTYLGYTEGYYYKPRVNYDMLFENSEGLLATSSCMASLINQCVKTNNITEAEVLFKKFIEKFGDNFYGEIQFNEINDKNKFGISQKECNKVIIDLCNKYDVPILIGGDVHYATPEDAGLQDVIIGSKMNSKDGAEKKENFIHAKSLYYHVSEDYYRFNKEFGYNYDEKLITEALDNSLKFAEKAEFEFELDKINFPKYQDPIITDKKNEELIEELVFQGLIDKISKRREMGEEFSDELITKYEQQVEYELKIIKEKKITDYFLIVQDVINWCKNKGYLMGPGRGSAAGALISYALGITNVDPIKHGLYFERFQNPERQCLTKNNDILMKDGTYKNITEINVGDQIKTESGRGNLVQIIKRETEVFEEKFIIETECGAKVELTENHIIPIMRDNKRIEIKVKELLESDLLFVE